MIKLAIRIATTKAITHASSESRWMNTFEALPSPHITPISCRRSTVFWTCNAHLLRRLSSIREGSMLPSVHSSQGSDTGIYSSKKPTIQLESGVCTRPKSFGTRPMSAQLDAEIFHRQSSSLCAAYLPCVPLVLQHICRPFISTRAMWPLSARFSSSIMSPVQYLGTAQLSSICRWNGPCEWCRVTCL